jgi:hypothetical protein
MEQIEQAARRLYRIQANLELVAKAGPEAGLANVMEVNDLIREEVARVLILLDQAGQVQAMPAAIAPALKEKGEVLAFRPSPTA